MLSILKKCLIGIVYIVIFFILIIAFILITEFSPKNGENLKVIGKETKTLKAGDTVTLLTYNIGHLISGSKQDSFLEGGKMVKPENQTVVDANLEGVKQIISDANADIVALQEVDYNANISYNVNEYIALANDYEGKSSIALFQNTFVPYPIDNMVGRVKSGISVMSLYDFKSCRINLEQDFDFPERIFMPKKCILKQIIDIQDSDKKLVILNVELEDYDDGHVREKQLNIVKDEMLKEFNEGNYVIVVGDFNNVFPDIENTQNIVGEYVVTNFNEDFLPEKWNYGVDKTCPTFRLKNEPYDKDKSHTWIVDGFIVSPNITIKSVKTIDTGFEYSNHNPVKLQLTLQK